VAEEKRNEQSHSAPQDERTVPTTADVFGGRKQESADEAAGRVARIMGTRPRLGNIQESLALILVLAGLVIFFAIKAEFFWSRDNIVNILQTMAPVGIIAMPATLLLVAGQVDLSVGSGAGIVGLILVGLYMLAYYRLLGIVAVASLAISGSVLWSLISWLGESRGLALTLAGTTGIIVSIGVQVDSNIVYYERIKEEVRRGRAVRSAADASFKGAFMTIVWADLASLICAGVLYQLTSGTVRGFALSSAMTRDSFLRL